VLTLLLIGSASAASSRVGDVVISRVTVTAAKIHGDSAVAMTIANNSAEPISLISVTSPVAKTSMIDYDVNMCQGNHAMTLIANILITSRRTQELGYKFQGAMLRELKTAIVKGGTIPLVVTWSDFNKVHTETVAAKIVKPPKNLFFGMTAMEM
jgi:copper(I)-binding protein